MVSIIADKNKNTLYIQIQNKMFYLITAELKNYQIKKLIIDMHNQTLCSNYEILLSIVNL